MWWAIALLNRGRWLSLMTMWLSAVVWFGKRWSTIKALDMALVNVSSVLIANHSRLLIFRKFLYFWIYAVNIDVRKRIYILKLRNKRIITKLGCNNNNLVWWKICMLRKLNLFLSPCQPYAMYLVITLGKIEISMMFCCKMSGHKSDWFAKFFYCQCPGINKSLMLIILLYFVSMQIYSR